MSQGKLAGIIVGGLAAAALLVALPVACCLWRLRRQQRNGLVDLEVRPLVRDCKVIISIRLRLACRW